MNFIKAPDSIPNRYNCLTCKKTDCRLIKRQEEDQTFTEIYRNTADENFREVMDIFAGMTRVVGCCSHSDRCNPKFLEQFSAIAHEEWAHWAGAIADRHSLMLDAYMALLQEYQRSTGNQVVGAPPFYYIERSRLKRWGELINTPYHLLSEDQKNEDRTWGMRMQEVADGVVREKE